MIRFLYKPTEKQKTFHLTKSKHKLYGGSAGGGKTDGLLGELLINCMKYPGIKQLFIRRTYGELTEILDERLKKFFECDTGLGYERVKGKNVIKFAGGEIMLGYWSGNKNTDKYFSMEYDVIAIDEITRTIYTYGEFEKLCSRNRCSKQDLIDKGFIPYIMCGTNPGGPGHGYIKKIFIDGDIPNGFEKKHFQFVPARLYDNPYLMKADPFYEIRLNALSDEDLKKALLHGDWNIFEGQFFTEFIEHKIVTDTFKYVGGPKKTILCLDYGFTSPSAVYKVSIDNDRNSYISKELYKTKLDYYSLGREIKNFYGKDEGIEYIVADPSIFTKSGNIESGAEIIAKVSGFKVIPGNNDRIPGWSKYREILKNEQVHIHISCPKLIREIKSAIHDGKKDGDLDSSKDDHGLDASRYGIVHIYGYGQTLKDLSNINDKLLKNKSGNILNTQF